MYVLIILFSTICTYVGGIVISKSKIRMNESYKSRIVLLGTIIINLGLLIYFKYSNFLIGCLNFIALKFRINVTIPNVDVLLPVGISFYIFQALGYAIDIYRGEIEPEYNFFKYALFVSFFPQLVAGPIERSKRLLPQINKIYNKKIQLSNIYHGVLYIVWGLFLKMVIADRISILVDNVFDNYYIYGGVELIVAAISFAIQIYCDFYGYSTVAVGTAEILGIDLVSNFQAPYLSMSIKEFWRRWHISLSNWFKDYLYIPLGGNRCTTIRKYINIITVFLVSGLWHGAAITYVIWGGLHGIYQVLGDVLKPVQNKIQGIFKINRECFSYRLGCIMGTFVLTDLAWIFFRAPGVSIALSYIKRIFVDFDPWIFSNGGLFELGIDRVDMNILICAIGILIISDILLYYKNITIVDFVVSQNYVFQYVCICFVVAFILIFGAYGSGFDEKAFVYFQF